MTSVTSCEVTGGRGTSEVGGVGVDVGLATLISVPATATGAGGADDAGGGDGGSGGVRINSDLRTKSIDISLLR